MSLRFLCKLCLVYYVFETSELLSVIHCKCYVIPAYVIQLKCCLDTLKLYLLCYKNTHTHNWDYKCKDIFCTKFQILKATYRNWANMLSWTQHFKVLCSLKTDCEIGLKNHLCKCLVARTLTNSFKCNGQREGWCCSPYLALSYTIKQ